MSPVYAYRILAEDLPRASNVPLSEVHLRYLTHIAKSEEIAAVLAAPENTASMRSETT